MARDEVRVDIVADDEASKVIDKVADKADDLEKKDPEVQLTADDEASRKIESLEADVRRLEDMVVELQIKADTSQAETGFQRVRQAADDTTTGIRNIGTESDNSRSVLANMAGNATQDLGALGGVAGSAGVAIGQLAEYATEGNIALSGLIKTAGPMLAIAAAVGIITAKMGDAKKKAEELKKANEDIAKSLKAGDIAAAADKINDQYAGLIDKAVDLGFSVEDVTDVLTGQSQTLPGLNDRLERYRSIVEDGTASSANHALAMSGQFDALRDLSGELDTASGSLSNENEILALNERRLGMVQTALGGVETANDETADAVEDLNTEMQRLNDLLSTQQGYLDAVSSADALAGAFENLITTLGDTEATQEDIDDAWRATEEQGGRLRQEIVDLVDEYGTIPEEEETRILAQLPEAQVEEYRGFIAEVEGAYTTDIHATSNAADVDRALNNAARDRDAQIRLTATFPRNPPPGWPRGAAWPPGSDAIIGVSSVGPSVPVPTPVSTQTVTVNLPRGSRPSDTIRAFESYSRRNGRKLIRR